MRHNKKINHLGRKKAHREAMLSNMATSLIKHKRIFTTTAKAKALRIYIEPLITKSKASNTKTSEEATHNRRVVFAQLQDKFAITELFGKIAEKIGDRPGGYTRIVKTGARLGDNASMCFIELVDFNENMLKDSKKAAAKTRRSRRKVSALATEVASTPAPKTKATAKKDTIQKEETPVSDEQIVDIPAVDPVEVIENEETDTNPLVAEEFVTTEEEAEVIEETTSVEEEK